MRVRGTVFIAAVVAALLAAPGCRRNCVPESIASNRNLIDLCADPDAHAPVGTGSVREVEAEFRRRTAATRPAGRPYHFLALSGGGMYGVFGVGLLRGWTESGTRPEFDVVTGISTGALMSTFAFLGPQYDQFLYESMVGVNQRDILRRRPLPYIPFADAIFTSRPLARRIEEYITPQVLCEVARAHAAGRRLYVGTTNLDTRRLIIWDMGAIAARGTPASAELYRNVVLASSSIPGAFPPVRLKVEIDGKEYEEMHVDGGTSDEVIFRSFMVTDLNRLNGVPGAQAPAGSTLYIVNNGKLYANPTCVRPLVFSELNASFRSLVYGKARDEFYRIYLGCLETGVEFRLAATPQDVKLEQSGGLGLSTEDQNKLYQSGTRIGQVAPVGEGWRDLPPGTDPSEQTMPRTGTKFATPAGMAGEHPPKRGWRR